MKYDIMYQTPEAKKQTGIIEQLLQLLRIVHDGDIINKHHKNWLLETGLAQQLPGGFNVISGKGIQYLIDLKLIHS